MNLNQRVKEWSEYVGMISEGRPEKQMKKIAEEVVETTTELAVYKLNMQICELNNPALLKKEIGDILFATKVLCNMLDFDPDECLKMACDKNDKRRDNGRMINGSYVKKEDLTINKRG